MPNDIGLGTFIVGVVCLLAGLFGGGLKAFGIELPKTIPRPVRFVAGFIGVILLIVSRVGVGGFTILGLAQATTSPNSVTVVVLNEHDLTTPTLTQFTPSGQLLCITTGQVTIANVAPRIKFTGYDRASVICWIGPQQAEAADLLGASVKQVEVQKGTAQSAADERTQAWADEMLKAKAACGTVGKCTGVDIAIISPNGTATISAVPK